MSPVPFPNPPDDPEEPDGSGLPPEDWEPGPDDDWKEGPGRPGLSVCLPPEQLTLAGFAQNGEADTMAPGPVLAAVVDAVTGQDGKGLAGCSDDQLMGIISAARRMESRNAWTVMAAMGEYAARHAGRRPADEFAPVELGYELHLNPTSAAEQMEFATTVAARLPATFAALGAGQIHPVHLRIIADETSFLSDQDAAKADQVLAGTAPGMTFGELRYAAHKLILRLDPEAARKRKEAARREAHVRRFREESGNAGMVARELPSDEVLASWQHIEQRALDLRAAGMPGTLQDLRVRAYLDLLQERDSRDLPAPAPAPASADAEPADAALADAGPAEEASVPDRPGPGQPPPGSNPPTPPDPGGGPGSPSAPGGSPSGPGGSGPAPRPGPGTGPSLAALVTITVPLATAQGRSDTPGEAAGFGILDGDTARDLLAAAARHPRTRWCITAVNPDGTAAAHACLRGRHPPPGTDPPRHRAAALAARVHRPADPRRPRSLRPRPRRGRLPPQPQAPASGPRPQRDLHRARLHPARRRLRPGPHRALGPGRADLRVWACPAMPPASSVQTGRRLAPRSAGTRSPEMACPVRAHLHHHSDRLPGLGRADQRALALT